MIICPAEFGHARNSQTDTNPPVEFPDERFSANENGAFHGVYRCETFWSHAIKSP
jgi:hypothetical protein